MDNIIGSRWWKFDFHAHSPASSDYKQKNVTPREWLMSHIKHGIECVAITDHNTSGWIDILKTEAKLLRNEGKVIYVFPGIELSTQGNVHILAIFDPSVEAQYVATTIGYAGYTGTLGDSDTDGSSSPEQVVKTISSSLNGVLIPAHIELAGSGLCKLGHKTVLRVCNEANAVEVVFPDKELMSVYKGTGLTLPQVIGSDSHSLEECGRAYTWVKMSAPTIDGLRLALLDGNTCIRRSDDKNFIPNTLPSSYLKQLTITNTKYCGRGQQFNVEFNPWLNSIVGSRGSGKSTLAEFVRIVLDKTDDIIKLDELNEVRRNFEKFYKVAKNRNDHGVLLNDSQIECIIQKNNMDYKISWNNKQKSHTISSHNGQEWIPEEGEVRNRFPVSIYSQKQIFDMAKEPNTLLSIIDSSKEVDISQWIGHRDALIFYFQQLCATRNELQNKISNKKNIQGQLADINAKISYIEKSGHTQVFKNYNKFFQNKKNVKNIFNLMQKQVGTLIECIESLDGLVPILSNFIIEDDDVTSHEIKKLAFKIESSKNEYHKKLNDLNIEICSLDEKIDSSILMKKYNDAYEKYRELVNSMQKEGIKEPSEYDGLVETKGILNKKLEYIYEKETELNSICEKINQQSNELIEWRKELTKRRNFFISKYINPHRDLKISIKTMQNIESIENSFREIINRSDGSFSSDLLDENSKQGILYVLKMNMEKQEEIEDYLSFECLEKFKNDIINYKEGSLILDCDIGKRFSNVIEQLDNDIFDKLRIWFPEDSLTVEFYDGRRFKPLDQGSAGQKAAAVLSFLLSYGDEPLIVDQPEDDLDNALISKLIILKLHQMKSSRQFLVITHNPNIVVNGDSELVIVLEDRGNITLSASGGLQELSVRQQVCEIMEGGKEALEKRYKRMKYV